MGNTTEFFPDGTVIPEWYYDTTIPSLKDLGIWRENPRPFNDRVVHWMPFFAMRLRYRALLN